MLAAGGQRVALLIDGDNLAASFADRLLAKAETVGDPIVKRVYASTGGLANWSAAHGYRLHFSGDGKNAADLMLTVDAMELALEGRVDAFVVGTSDRDLSHLAARLVERGHHVLGVGEDKAPSAFRLACSAFISLTPAKVQPAVRAPVGKADVLAEIEAIVEAHGGSDGIGLSQLGSALGRMKIDKKSAGCATWPKFFAKYPDRFRLNGAGTEMRVRLLPH